jgi:Holliday junction resolvase RusA-like endonuclease
MRSGPMSRHCFCRGPADGSICRTIICRLGNFRIGEIAPELVQQRLGGWCPVLWRGSADRLGSVMNAPFHMPSELVIALPMPPTTNNLFCGNGKLRYRSKEYTDWIKEAGWRLADQRPPLMAGKVILLIEVEEPKTARRQDVANREKAVTDLLVSHRVIQGDDQRFVRELTVRWAPVSGVVVTIRSAE